MSVISVDFGNHSTKIHHFYNGVFKTINSPTGNRTIPSRIVFNENNRLFGDFSIYTNKGLYNNIKNKLFDDKSIKSYENEKEQLLDKITYLTYQNKDINAKMLTIMYLTNIYKHIRFNLKDTVIPDMFVYTFPDYISDVNRYKNIIQQIHNEKNKIVLIPESIAIGLNYGLYKLMDGSYNKETSILFIDIGEISTSFYIIEYRGQEMKILFKWVIENVGSAFLDKSLTLYLYNKFLEQHNLDKECEETIIKNRIMKKIYYKCEGFRKRLNTNNKINCNIEAVYKDYDLNITITREEYNDCCRIAITKFRNSLIVFKHNFKYENIELIGGLSRFYIFNDILDELISKKIVKSTLNKEECISRGGSIYGANKMTMYKNIDIKIRYKYCFGDLYIKVNKNDPVLLIGKDDYIPFYKDIKFSSKENMVQIYREGVDTPIKIFLLKPEDILLKFIIGLDLIHHYIYKSMMNVNKSDENNIDNNFEGNANENDDMNNTTDYIKLEEELNKLDIVYHNKQTMLNKIEEHIYDYKNKGRGVKRLEKWMYEKSRDASIDDIKLVYDKINEN